MKLSDLIARLQSIRPQDDSTEVMAWIDGTFETEPMIWVNIIIRSTDPTQTATPYVCIGRPMVEQMLHDTGDAEPRTREFNRVWKAFTKDGRCDAFRGMEYGRVFAEWVAAGRPVDVSSFIAASANRMV